MSHCQLAQLNIAKIKFAIDHPETLDIESYSVSWWIAEGQLPAQEEASERLECLRELGPSARAFTFKQAFAPQ